MMMMNQQMCIKKMRVIITQSKNKELSIVNGQEALVYLMENATIFVHLPDQKVINVYR